MKHVKRPEYDPVVVMPVVASLTAAAVAVTSVQPSSLHSMLGLEAAEGPAAAEAGAAAEAVVLGLGAAASKPKQLRALTPALSTQQQEESQVRGAEDTHSIEPLTVLTTEGVITSAILATCTSRERSWAGRVPGHKRNNSLQEAAANSGAPLQMKTARMGSGNAVQPHGMPQASLGRKG